MPVPRWKTNPDYLAAKRARSQFGSGVSVSHILLRDGSHSFRVGVKKPGEAVFAYQGTGGSWDEAFQRCSDAWLNYASKGGR